MGEHPDSQRMIGDLVRLCTVASVDPATATCRVAIGDIVTGDVPWLAVRAGRTRSWSVPSLGEQGILLCPEADTNAGIFIAGLYSNARPAPASEESADVVAFDDGARIAYDQATHQLRAILPAGGTALIEALGGITLRGDVRVEGKITASGDVVAGGVSLQDHRHDKVQAGGAISGKPVP